MPTRPGNVAEADSGLRYQPLAVLLVAVVVGILIDRFAKLSPGAWWTLACFAWSIWALLAMPRCASSLREVCLLVCVAAIGGQWHHADWYLFPVEEFGRYARDDAQPVCVEVIARQEPQRMPAPAFDPMRAIPPTDRERLEVDVVALRDGQSWRPVSGRSQLLVDGHLLGIHAGDRLRVFGRVARSRSAQNPGEFDFANYARGDRLRCVLRANYPDCVTLVAAGRWSSPRRVIGQLRGRGDRMLRKQIRPSRRPLASAILLGERNLLSTEQTETFMTTGSVHLLVVSGLHVAMLAGVLLVVMRLGLLPRRASWMLVVALVVLYGVLTGGRPPVVRAVVLISVLALGKIVGRRAWSFNSLAAAALVVLALNPAELFRTGTQLSFLAVAVLMVIGARWNGEISDPLDRLIAESRSWPHRILRWCGRYYWRLTVASIAVWLVCLPLVMARFHLCTPVTVLAGPLLWLPMAVALLAGFGVLLCEWLVPPAGRLFAVVCDAACGLLHAGAEWAADLPGGHLWLPGPAEWWLIGFYGGLAALIAYPRYRPAPRWCAALLAGWVVVGVTPALLRQQDDTVRATFISVGHGSSVLLELPDGHTILYDAGALASPTSAARSIAAVLWTRGKVHVDAIVLSHADVDHYNALPDLLKRFTVGMVLVSPMMFEHPSAAIDALRAEIEAAGVPIREIYAGDRLRAEGGVQIGVLHPPRTGVLGSDNANSLVVLVEYEGRKLLLPGDLESPGLDDLMAERPIDCDVLMAPHHGSRRSDPPGFAAWSTPDVLIVSGGRASEAQTVEQAYAAEGAKVMHTAVHGAITIDMSRRRMETRPWRPGASDQ